jgi:hypothetical protein
MLELASVEQILRVLELIRQNNRLGFDISAATSRAIQQVARESNVRYQTIGDGCRRRLGLTDISEFHRLAEEWLRGNSTPIAKVIKNNSSSSAASRISAFFSDSDVSGRRAEASRSVRRVGGAKEAASDPFSIKVEDADARMLRVLSQLEERDPAVIALELLREGMRDRLRAALT